ncbi:MAG: poly(ADP-ribose) glycohydrolase domain-containing protein [Coprococcus sp.]
MNGAGAQEECLCRCSNLYFCLNTLICGDVLHTTERHMIRYITMTHHTLRISLCLRLIQIVRN